MTIRQFTIDKIKEMIPGFIGFQAKDTKDNRPLFIRVHQDGRIFQSRFNPSIPNTWLVGVIKRTPRETFDESTWMETVEVQFGKIPEGWFDDEVRKWKK